MLVRLVEVQQCSLDLHLLIVVKYKFRPLEVEPVLVAPWCFNQEIVILVVEISNYNLALELL